LLSIAVDRVDRLSKIAIVDGDIERCANAGGIDNLRRSRQRHGGRHANEVPSGLKVDERLDRRIVIS
jgi:hypothetical protein